MKITRKQRRELLTNLILESLNDGEFHDILFILEYVRSKTNIKIEHNTVGNYMRPFIESGRVERGKNPQYNSIYKLN